MTHQTYRVTYLNHQRDQQKRILQVRENFEGEYFAHDISGQGEYPNNNLGCGNPRKTVNGAIRDLVDSHGILIQYHEED